MTDAKDKQKQENVLNVEPWYNKYKEWSLKQEKGKTISLVVGGLIVSAVVIALVTFVPIIPSWAYPFLTFPIGIFLFLAGLHLSFKYELSHPEHVPIKTRWSFRRRIKMFALFAVLFMALLLGARNYIPEALGGSITIAALIAFYNAIRRSPEEIKLDAAGITDPRDDVGYVEDEERSEFFAPEDDYDEDSNFYDDLTEKGR